VPDAFQPIGAHLGHWYIEVPIYLGPVLAIWVWLKVAGWRQNRREAPTSRRALGGGSTGKPDREVRRRPGKI
jgi:hypothetical protein